MRSVSFSADGRTLATASDDKTVKLWSLPAQRFVATLAGHSNWVRTAQISPDGRLVVSAGDDRCIKVGRCGLRGRWGVDWEQRGWWIGVVDQNNQSLTVFKPLPRPPNPRITTRSLTSRPARSSAATRTRPVAPSTRRRSTPTARRWPAGAPTRASRWALVGESSLSKQWWGRAGESDAFGLLRGAGKCDWRQKQPKPQSTSAIKRHPPTPPNDQIWDLRSDALLQHYRAHTAAVTGAAFHPSGSFLLTSSLDATLKVWDLREGQLFYTLHGHEGATNAVAFSPAGDYFSSAGADEQVRFWGAYVTCVVLRRFPCGWRRGECEGAMRVDGLTAPRSSKLPFPPGHGVAHQL